MKCSANTIQEMVHYLFLRKSRRYKMQIIMFLSVLILGTILTGVYFYTKKSLKGGKKKLLIFLSINIVVFLALVMASSFSYEGIAYAAEGEQAAEASGSSGLGYIAAALSTGL